MPTTEDLRSRALRVALENALRHGSDPRPESVLGALLGGDPELRSRKELVRSVVEEAVREVVALSPGAREERLRALGGATTPAGRTGPREERSREPLELPPLPGAVPGKVVLRFAPFPSGALHVGHARALWINDAYRERYQGRFLLVFDDTVGSAEKRPDKESYDLIQEDFRLAGIRVDALHYKSDRIPEHYRHLPPLLEKRAAYVCLCPPELLRKNRLAGVACPERDRDPGWQEDAWQGMLSGRYGVGEAVVRLRTDMQHPNPAFRDRVLFRISDLDNPRVGRRYRVWPLLEYSWAVDDVDLGITHVIRGKDLVMEDEMERALWKVMGARGPELLHFGLLRLRVGELSKSKFQREIASGVFEGWSDPRTWSLRSLWQRGIQPESLKEFVLSFGLSLADIEVPAETLYAYNRQRLDPVTPRRSFVPAPVQLRVTGVPPWPGPVELANHPEHPEMGRRALHVGSEFYLPRADLEAHAGEEIRLKDLMNVRLPHPLAPGVVEASFVDLPNRPLPRIQWVPSEGACPVSVVQIDGSRVEGLAEPSVSSAREGEIYQFERVGFVRAGSPSAGAPRRFHLAHG